MDVQDIIGVGQTLGLEGEDLHQFVKETQARERDERAARREEEKAKREEAEAIRAFEERENKAKREHEIRMKELEISAASTTSQSVQPTVSHCYSKKGPKLQMFNEDKDDMDSFLLRFERYADIQKYDRSEYAIYLSALLQGSALDVYTRLSATEANDYEVLKTALLKHYLLTEEGFRKKFHGSRIDRNETASQYMSRLCNYFDR